MALDGGTTLMWCMLTCRWRSTLDFPPADERKILPQDAAGGTLEACATPR